MPMVALDTITNINNDNPQGPEEKDTLNEQNLYCLQLLDVDVLHQHCIEVERLLLSERRVYKRIKRANKENQQRQSRHISCKINSGINNKNSDKCVQGLFYECRRLTLRLEATLERALLARSDPYPALPFFCIEDNTLETRIKEASKNKLDNRGLFHNLENPYTRPSWASALIDNIYEPSLDLARERQAAYQAEDQEDYSPALHVVSSVADFALHFEPEMNDWECDWVLIVLEGTNLDYSEVNEDLLEQVKPYHKSISKTVYFNPITQCLPYIAAEIMTLPNSVFFAASKTSSNTAALPNRLAPRTILKPVSAPRITDCTNASCEPITIACSKFNARYFKNIPRLIEFAHVAETKMGIKIESPTGY
jgi:hypothetical protein